MHNSGKRRQRQRSEEPGHAHRLTCCCYHRYQFLAAERTCQCLADAMNEARQAQPFWLWAYVFMPEHIHLNVYPLPLSVPGVEAIEEASEVGWETVDEGRAPGVESGRPAGGGLNFV